MKFSFEDNNLELIPTWVDVWYDRSQRMWAAQLKTDEGYLVGNTEWGTKGDIELTLKEWIRDYKLNKDYIKKMQKEYKSKLREDE